jgi:feruloyl esterase
MNPTRYQCAATSPAYRQHGRLMQKLAVGLPLLMGSASALAATSTDTCNSLAKLALPTATVTQAVVVPAGTYQFSSTPLSGLGQLPGMNVAGQVTIKPNPAFCRIAATLKPSQDSDIKMEVWLPLTHWNGKFLAVGNFGWAGSLMEPGMMTGLNQGYATASTDTGHDSTTPNGNGGQFAYGHQEKLIDYGYRADHLMTVHAKTIIHAFYKKDPSHAYWIGCSLGGLEGLIEAKRYPADYDGMVIGAPPNPLVNFNAAQLWPSWLVQKDPSLKMPEAKFELVHQAVLKSCATKIGQQQGFVDHPEQCHFQPRQLQCKSGDQADCLTAPQVHLMEQIYQGPVNPRTHQVIFPGPARGSEDQLAGFADGKPFGNALDLFQYAAFQNPKWDWRAMDWDKDIAKATASVGPLLSVDAAGLQPYFANGGKMLLYVGWNDYHNPNELIGYYQTLIQHVGPRHQNSAKLFTIPGMGHCFGGAGCDTFNKLGVMDAWVSHGKIPMRIVARHADQQHKVVRSRPLCAYPQTARYQGHGDINAAQNFVCRAGTAKPL